MPASPTLILAATDAGRLAATEPAAFAEFVDHLAVCLKAQAGPGRTGLRATSGHHHAQARRLGLALERVLLSYEQDCDQQELEMLEAGA